MMPTHELQLEGGPRDEFWAVAWYDATFSLTAPNGERVCEGPADRAYEALDFYELFSEGAIEFVSPGGSLTFRKNKEAVRELQELIQDNLRKDDEFRETLETHVRKIIPRGLAAFIVGTTLFVLYCLWAANADDPPPGHWLRWFGWLIHLALLGCLGLAIGGPLAMWFGWKQLRLIRRIEADASREAKLFDGDDW